MGPLLLRSCTPALGIATWRARLKRTVENGGRSAEGDAPELGSGPSAGVRGHTFRMGNPSVAPARAIDASGIFLPSRHPVTPFRTYCLERAPLSAVPGPQPFPMRSYAWPGPMRTRTRGDRCRARRADDAPRGVRPIPDQDRDRPGERRRLERRRRAAVPRHSLRRAAGRPEPLEGAAAGREVGRRQGRDRVRLPAACSRGSSATWRSATRSARTACPSTCGRRPRPPSAKLPVMVWIYGGGFQSPAPPRSRARTARASPRKGVVVVSFNYRLGLMGFFAHPELSEGIAAQGVGQLRHPRSDRGAAVGAEEHRGVRRRSRQRHHLRRVGRLVLGQHADGLAARQGPVPQGDRRERRVASRPGRSRPSAARRWPRRRRTAQKFAASAERADDRGAARQAGHRSARRPGHAAALVQPDRRRPRAAGAGRRDLRQGPAAQGAAARRLECRRSAIERDAAAAEADRREPQGRRRASASARPPTPSPRPTPPPPTPRRSRPRQRWPATRSSATARGSGSKSTARRAAPRSTATCSTATSRSSRAACRTASR